MMTEEEQARFVFQNEYFSAQKEMYVELMDKYLTATTLNKMLSNQVDSLKEIIANHNEELEAEKSDKQKTEQ